MSKHGGLEPLTWRGRKLFRCRLCSFDSLDKKKFEQHFARAHPPLQVIDGGQVETKGIHEMTRGELDRAATDVGITGVEKFSTKADLIAAIEAAQEEKEK